MGYVQDRAIGMDIVIYNKSCVEKLSDGGKAKMTGEGCQEERLNRIADTMGDIAQKMEELTQKIGGTSKRFKNNISLVRRMRDVMALTAEERREIIGVIAQEQSDIRAMQAENSRKLQMLKNRPHQDDNPDS